MPFKKYTFLVLCMITAACNQEESEDKTKDINKDGAIEAAIAVTHIDSTHDVITSTYKTWAKGIGTQDIVHHDTVASLGYEMKKGTDANNNEIEVLAPKDYEIYITVK